MSDRVCPECGTDRYLAERHDRLLQRREYLQRSVERLARENGLLSFRLKDAHAWAEEQRAGLQRKVTRQARVIRRLEKRISALGEKPHEGVALHETAPVSDIPDVKA